jgi:hypothetical protein
MAKKRGVGIAATEMAGHELPEEFKQMSPWDWDGEV